MKVRRGRPKGSKNKLVKAATPCCVATETESNLSIMTKIAIGQMDLLKSNIHIENKLTELMVKIDEAQQRIGKLEVSCSKECCVEQVEKPEITALDALE